MSTVESHCIICMAPASWWQQLNALEARATAAEAERDEMKRQRDENDAVVLALDDALGKEQETSYFNAFKEAEAKLAAAEERIAYLEEGLEIAQDQWLEYQTGYDALEERLQAETDRANRAIRVQHAAVDEIEERLQVAVAGIRSTADANHRVHHRHMSVASSRGCTNDGCAVANEALAALDAARDGTAVDA